LQQSAKPAKNAPEYGTYKAADIKTWLTPYKRDPKTMKALRAFVDDYERAERENDTRYNALNHLYKPAKEKLGNG